MLLLEYMIKRIVHFFDRLEDKIRGKLSHYPILYALVGGVGIVLFWRGIWHTVDEFLLWSGPTSLIIGSVILLITGVFVSSFVGTRLIISGIKGEKTIVEKSSEEIKNEESEIKKVENKLNKIESEILEIKSEIDKK